MYFWGVSSFLYRKKNNDRRALGGPPLDLCPGGFPYGWRSLVSEPPLIPLPQIYCFFGHIFRMRWAWLLGRVGGAPKHPRSLAGEQ